MKRSSWLCAALVSSTMGCQPAGQADDVAERAAAVSSAGVDLVAVGSLSGTRSDLSRETADPLENGVAGNLLGGLGSGLAYAGWGRFVAVPDRGPNAVPYNGAVDDTTSYIARMHTIRMSLERSPRGAALPLSLTPHLEETTLLSSRQPLYYGSHPPTLNERHHTHYFTGRSDNFDPSAPSSDAFDGRLDPESVRVANDGLRVFVSDEYGPFVYEFSRITGHRLRSFALPPEFAVAHADPQGAVEISANTSGRVANKGMEGLAITPDGRTLYGAMQSALLQDNGTSGRFTRIIAIDTWTGTVTQHAYELTNIGTAAKPKYPTISEVVAINGHQLLVDERDGKGLGDNSTAVFKRIYRIDLAGAPDVSGVSGEANLAGKAMAKELFLDVVATLNAHGIASNDIPAKLEGLAFGPDLFVDGVLAHTLWLANDNDFVGTVVDSNHPAGIANPNQFFVFAVDCAALPGFVPQSLPSLF
ncbi:MAG: esterase-like activity of phytase family protein [Polyangia bacterium]